MCWEGRLIKDSEVNYSLGKIKIRIIWDSIWRHFRDYQIIFLSRNQVSHQGIEHFLHNYPWDGTNSFIHYLDNLPVISIHSCLEKAKKLEANKIAFIPFAGGNYLNAIEDMRGWSYDYPKEIGFFHLHQNDYHSIIRYCQSDT